MDGDRGGFSTWSYPEADPVVPAGGAGWDRSWTARVPPSWPPATSEGSGVADAAFTAASEWFVAAPPAAGYLHPLRVDRDGEVAVLVFRWRADPRRFAVRIGLPTRLLPLDDGWGGGVGWGVPGLWTGLVASGPVAWADELHGLLEEELLTGAMRGPTRRDGDLVVVDLANRGAGDTDHTYYLSSGTWGRVVDRRLHVNQESVPPADIIRRAGFPTGELVAAGRAGTLVAWLLVWVDTTSGGPLVGQAVCVATGPPAAATAALAALDVHPAHTGRGLEERLLTGVLGDAADAGITTLDRVTAAPPIESGWFPDPTRPGRIRLDV